MKKLVLIVAAVAALAVPAAASAMTSSQALTWGTGVARNDCGRASDWFCISFPTQSNVWSCADNRWCVSIAYREQHIFGGNRTCWTDTHWTIVGNVNTYSHKYC